MHWPALFGIGAAPRSASIWWSGVLAVAYANADHNLADMMASNPQRALRHARSSVACSGWRVNRLEPVYEKSAISVSLSTARPDISMRAILAMSASGEGLALMLCMVNRNGSCAAIMPAREH
jgi:hypothetical protein